MVPVRKDHPRQWGCNRAKTKPEAKMTALLFPAERLRYLLNRSRHLACPSLPRESPLRFPHLNKREINHLRRLEFKLQLAGDRFRPKPDFMSKNPHDQSVHAWRRRHPRIPDSALQVPHSDARLHYQRSTLHTPTAKSQASASCPRAQRDLISAWCGPVCAPWAGTKRDCRSAGKGIRER